MAIYNINGKRIDLNYGATVNSTNHRGYSTEAPENTIPAYILSKKKGFDRVETDIAFTSDGIPVLLHDSTIDRTSNGTGSISQMTLEQVRQYDFGSWKDSKYAGTKIPTLDEFLSLCRAIMLHPYLELKNSGDYTEAQIRQIVDMVESYGLKGKVSYISFSTTYLGYVKSYDPSARLGFLKNTYEASDINTCLGLRTATNEVFYAPAWYEATQAVCDACMAEGIPVEVWIVNEADRILSLNHYISGITSDSLIAGKILYDNAMS